MPNYVDPSSGREILLTDAFSYNGNYEVKATGFTGTATAGVTTNLDFAIGAEDRYIHGVRILVKNHADGDTVDLYVVDVDGIIPEAYRAAYPNYPVLKQFGINWNLDHEKSDQGKEQFNFLAKINAGLYLRVGYNSIGSTNITVKLNAYLQKLIS
jgi:hypothetical protein